MIERFTNGGKYLRTVVLNDRRRVEEQSLLRISPAERAVELVEKDTAYPDGHIFEHRLNDKEKGEQVIRVVKTTKPYNPDFIVSAQTLTYLFPSDFSRRIVTPLDGTEETWLSFLRVNKICAEGLEKFYQEKGIKNFLILLGMNFSPYTPDREYLETQAVKAAHMHAFLISEDLM